MLASWRWNDNTAQWRAIPLRQPEALSITSNLHQFLVEFARNFVQF
jgi:hypothetical protein